MRVCLENVSKTYDDAGRRLTVLDAVNAEIASGVHCSIIGRSGVGKSTLLHLLGALDAPTGGTIYLGETNLSQLAGDARSDFRGEHIGFIFQFHHLLAEFTALENVAMPLFIQDIPADEALERAEEILTLTGLQARLTHRPGELSGGEQQRVAVARALVHRPAIVLADEPTGSLDVETGLEVQALISDICRQFESTLIVVTHNRELAFSFESVFEMFPGGRLEPSRQDLDETLNK